MIDKKRERKVCIMLLLVSSVVIIPCLFGWVEMTLAYVSCIMMMLYRVDLLLLPSKKEKLLLVAACDGWARVSL